MSFLSIITVNLNNKEGLHKTLISVFNQEYNDYEYIVIDGGSKDNSKEILIEFSKATLKDFKWISEPDSGIFEAMNKGIRLATGEYLLFLNSGDFLVNNNVLDDVFAKTYTADFLLGRCNLSKNGVVLHTTSPPQKLTFGYLYTTGLAHQATFIKREMFERFGLYREEFRFNSDIEFWYRTIVLRNCSTETLETVISDYNMDGITSKLHFSESYQNEMQEIFSDPLLQLFIPDYEAWAVERKGMNVMYWAKSKKLVYSLVLALFNIAKCFSKIRRSLWAA